MSLKTFAATLSFSLLSCFAACAEEANPVNAWDFSSGLAGWEFSIGAEFPGAVGNLWRAEGEGASGNGAACLLGDFRRGGNYVGMRRSFSEPVDAKRVSLRLKTGDLTCLIFRICDSTGQTFQKRLDLKGVSGWQTIEFGDFADGASSWGGAKDGKWHAPAKSMQLILDRGNLKDSANPKGSLLVESVELRL